MYTHLTFDLSLSRYAVGQNIITSIVELFFYIFTVYAFDFDLTLSVYAFDFDLTLSRHAVGQNIITSIVETFFLFLLYTHFF